jgi:ABC-type antimicrobial peptide transport system permease subunit
MDGWILIWYVVVFIAMGFGIVNTVLMAVFERIREFGLLKALGMKPWWIIRGVLIESFFLLFIGTALGNGLGFLTNWIFLQTGIDLSFFAAGAQHFGMSRIIYPSVNPLDIVLANMVVFVLGMLVSLYPASRAARFTPVEALAHT